MAGAIEHGHRCQTVRIGTTSLQVIGIMEAKGVQAAGSQDDVVFVPLSTKQATINWERSPRGGLLVTNRRVH